MIDEGLKELQRKLQSAEKRKPLYREMSEMLSHDPHPAPWPPDLGGDEAMYLSVVDSGWRIDHNFACRNCGAPAIIHPYTNEIWGCLACNYSTLSVSVYFRRSDEPG